ncbi:hypothetical protein [uncultured Tateyamaria sp.]|uniref:hypothetical protein n=1 Tax=uncultured Tateyamaria sp. TaxID=455651 RepID=UPI0026383999|nr:hypothetical protein [uncultured Tateyamaria sp.]
MPAPLLDRISRWPDPAQIRLQSMRAMFHDVAQAADVGPLDESLKWGHPAWRPRRARMGSTLRLHWSEGSPKSLIAFVDCKTNLAQQMQTRFPEIPTDGRREIRLALDQDHADAIWQLAYLTFTYHRARQAAAR